MERTTELATLACLICDDLKKLAGSGFTLEKCARCSQLRKLLNIGPRTRNEVAGPVVWEFSEQCIDALEGSYRFERKEYEADVLKQAYRALFGLDNDWKAIDRRYTAMRYLDLGFDVDYWRNHKEYKFLYILAETMV
jgi:hypothetical protein